MKYFDWDPANNLKLQAERGVSFEGVETAIEEGRVLEIGDHPNREKYPGQSIAVVEIDGYAYAVPYVEDAAKIFLKTIIPNRKMTKRYLKDKK